MDETRGATRAIVIACAALGVAAAVVFLAVSIARVTYPYELEFQEGDIFLTALRVLDGRAIYPDPNIDATHVPVLYTPFFYVVCAGAIAAFGKSLAACRAVSIIATLVLAALIARLAWRRAGPAWAMACAGAFLAFFPASGWWFDLARVDMLFLALCAGAFALIGGALTNRRLAGAAGLLVAAMSTKQVALFFAATACLAVFVRAPKRGVLFGAAMGIVAIVIALALNEATGGQFFFFTLIAPRSHPVHLERLLEPWGLVAAVGPIALAVIAGAVMNRGGETVPVPDRRVAWVWPLFLLAALPASLLPWIKQGHYLNNFIPIALALVALAATMRPHALTALLVGAQMFVTWQNPAPQIPAADARARGDAFIAQLRAEPGDVYVMDHPYYAWLAGREILAKGMFIAEAEKAGRKPPRDLAARIDAGKFAKIIVDIEPPFDPFSSRILRRYRVAGPLAAAPEPLTGTLAMRPRLALVPVETIATVEFGAEPPPGWQAQGDAWTSPYLPDDCASVSFDIDAAAGTTARLIGEGGRPIFQTRGVPDAGPMRARWSTERCGAAPCFLHFANPRTHRPDGVTGLQIER